MRRGSWSFATEWSSGDLGGPRRARSRASGAAPGRPPRPPRGVPRRRPGGHGGDCRLRARNGVRPRPASRGDGRRHRAVRSPRAQRRGRALGALANVRARSYRLVVRPVDLGRPDASAGPAPPRSTASSRATSRTVSRWSRAVGLGRAGEAVIERGLADAWNLGPGDRLRVGRWRGTVVAWRPSPTTSRSRSRRDHGVPAARGRAARSRAATLVTSTAASPDGAGSRSAAGDAGAGAHRELRHERPQLHHPGWRPRARGRGRRAGRPAAGGVRGRRPAGHGGRTWPRRPPAGSGT